MGHVLEHRPSNIASTLGSVGGGSRQAFYGDGNDAAVDEVGQTPQWSDGSASSAGLGPSMDDATADQSAYYGRLPDAGYEATDSDTASSATGPVDLSDLGHLNDEDVDAELDWQYREAKRRWRYRVDKPSRFTLHLVFRIR